MHTHKIYCNSKQLQASGSLGKPEHFPHAKCIDISRYYVRYLFAYVLGFVEMNTS